MENTDHVILCTKRKELFHETIEKFKKYLSTIQTAPIIKEMIISGLLQWGKIENTCRQIPNTAVMQAMIEQSTIGWNMVPRGLLSVTWAIEQEKFALLNNDQTIGDSWSGKVSNWWITESYNIWKSRNDAIHSTDTMEDTRGEQETKAQISKLYEQMYNISRHDRVLLAMPLTERLQQTPEAQNIWLEVNKITIRQCMTEHTQKLLSGQIDIRKYCKTNKKQSLQKRNHKDTNIYATRGKVETNYRHTPVQQKINKYFSANLQRSVISVVRADSKVIMNTTRTYNQGGITEYFPSQRAVGT